MRSSAVLSLCVAVVALSSAPVSAQSTRENFQKYEQLRTRLRSDFIARGTGPGDAIPASERRDAISRIRWADATIRLGWHIGVLASELGMLDQAADFPGYTGDRDQTERLLYEALIALERLDRVADASFPAPCTSEELLNGFFIRDDVPANFHTRFEGMEAVASDFLDAETQKEMSQDQAYHVLMGLALVKRYVDRGLVIEGRPLRAMAVEIAERITRHIAESEPTAYIIKNPACMDRDVARGAGAAAYGTGIVEMISFITDGAYQPDPGAVPRLWFTARTPASLFYMNPDNMHMAMTIAAVGRGFGDTTMTDLTAIAETHGWQLYPLLLQALHNDTVGFCQAGERLNTAARAMLNELPVGEIPRSPLPGPALEHGWTTSNRFIRASDEHYVGSEGSEGAEFNGLDYLLLHNLFYLATPAEWEGGAGEGVPSCPPPVADAGADGGTDSGVDSGIDGGADAGADGGTDLIDDGGCSVSRGTRPSVALWFVLGLFAFARRR